jgi:integral membrane sensor domain MASE1
MAAQASLHRVPNYSRWLGMRMKMLAAFAVRWSGRALRGADGATGVSPLADARVRPSWGRGVAAERRLIQLMLVASGGVFVASALSANAGSALLALFACMTCGTRIERNYQRGRYRRVPSEDIE